MTPSSRQFRAPLVTHKPTIPGPQSALVVGKQGEEIDVDEHGRILVQFYWDRKKKPSRRVRVAQIWAGSQRGALFLPRIGDEVMVAYEDGDPDRPIVVGSVYNGTNDVVADLPAKKTRSGILTKSSKNSAGYNMLLFDDTAGEERVKLRAQKALMFKALGDETRDINGSQTETVGGDETITVGGPTGGGDFTLNATKSITLNVGPSGSFAQIVMDQTGITLSVAMGVSSIMIQPSGVTILAPTIAATGDAAVNVTAAVVNVGAVLNTPELNAGAATVSGAPV
jgi:type VI secretion system secreted protein VgrG